VLAAGPGRCPGSADRSGAGWRPDASIVEPRRAPGLPSRPGRWPGGAPRGQRRPPDALPDCL